MASATVTFALRFPRSQELRLRAVDAEVEARGMDAVLYHTAADSAERDEPLRLLGADRDEAEQIAALFVQCGFDRPAIDELNV